MKDMQNTRVCLKVFSRVVAQTKDKGEHTLGGVAYRFNPHALTFKCSSSEVNQIGSKRATIIA